VFICVCLWFAGRRQDLQLLTARGVAEVSALGGVSAFVLHERRAFFPDRDRPEPGLALAGLLCMADILKRFPHGNLTYRIVGCFLDVFKELGRGYSEHVYRRALAIVLRENGFSVLSEHRMTVMFHGQQIGSFKADLVVNRSVLVEIKATPTIEDYAIAQTLNYLKAAGGGVGLVLNFGRIAEHQRLVMGDNPADSLPVLRSQEASSQAPQK
jgi:GxxExxY protein